MTVIELADDSEYVTKLNEAAQRLVVAVSNLTTVCQEQEAFM